MNGSHFTPTALVVPWRIERCLTVCSSNDNRHSWTVSMMGKSLCYNFAYTSPRCQIHTTASTADVLKGQNYHLLFLNFLQVFCPTITDLRSCPQSYQVALFRTGLTAPAWQPPRPVNTLYFYLFKDGNRPWLLLSVDRSNIHMQVNILYTEDGNASPGIWEWGTHQEPSLLTFRTLLQHWWLEHRAHRSRCPPQQRHPPPAKK